MKKTKYEFMFLFILFFSFFFFSCIKKDKFKDGRLIVNYWEKWTGFECDAMRAVVDKFNASQDKIYIEMLSISNIDRKMVVATASGNPPDLAGVWTTTVPILADKGAVTDLTEYYKKAGISEKNFIPFYWKLLNHRQKAWAMISTPATIGLYWNKRLFREAGLDPNKPPITIAELDEYSDKLTFFKEGDKKVSFYEIAKRFNNDQTLASEYIEKNKLNMIQVGFLPSEPGWWIWSFGYFFGGTIFEEPDKISLYSKENVEAYRWVQSFMKKYGEHNVKKFSSGFGNFSSPQNAFLSSKIAMEVQGVWMYNFIDKYSPGMEWGAAPIPTKTKELYGTALGEGDVLVIPKGARHIKEAFEFIKFLAQPENMELLCLGQRKFTPLAVVTDEFYKKHPHPYIRVFRQLAESKNLFTFPRTGIWNEYVRDLSEACSRIWDKQEDPEIVFKEIAPRNQRTLDLDLEILKKRGKL